MLSRKVLGFFKKHSNLCFFNKFFFARNVNPKKLTQVANQEKYEKDFNEKQDLKKSSNPKDLKSLNPAISSFQQTTNQDKHEEKSMNFNKESDNKKIKVESIENLVKSFNEKKASFDIMFYLRFLNESIKTKRYNSKSMGTDINLKRNIYNDLLKLPEISECISVLKNHVNDMQNKQLTNYLSILSKMDYYDGELLTYISKTVKKKEINLNSVSISYLVWTLAKFKTKDVELLDNLAKSLINQKQRINIQSQANVFWSLSVLNYNKEELTKTLEEIIIKNALNYDMTCINLIFGAYCNTGAPNYDVLDSLSMKILSINNFTFRNIANWLNYCANLNYTNLNCFNLIERVMIKKVRAFEDIENLKDIKAIQNLETEILNELKAEAQKTKSSIKDLKEKEMDPEILDKHLNKINEEMNNPLNEIKIKDDILTPFDASQILLSFCKLKVVKPELFEVLEAAFIKMLPIANPSSFSAFAYAHSSLCNEMQMKFYENKKYLLRRSVKNLKKYNQMFYELMLPYIKLRLPEFKFEEIYSILLSASRPLVKKRAVCRDLIDLGVNALPLIKPNLLKLPQENLEKTIFQYFKVIMNFVFKDEQRILLEKSFQDLNLDIKLICVKYGYLIPQSSEIELKNDYEEEIDDKINNQKEKEVNKEDTSK